MLTDELAIAERFHDRYTILARIGGGSFGVVYSAFDTAREREVAVKILRHEAQQDPALVERFEREAEICSQLTNPHTARLHGFAHAPATDTYAAMPYMVFDLVRGLPLGYLLKFRHKVAVEEAAHILIGVLESLEEAHQQGIVHRDIKPDNILCVPPAGSFQHPDPEGQLHRILGVPPLGDPVWTDLTGAWIRVVDFGLGKVLEIADRKVKALTRAGMAAGTATYMSPEQLQADELDHRSDIYSAAMVLHRMIVGTETYPGKAIAQVAMAHVRSPLPDLPPPLSDHPIADVFAKAGAKAPGDRYGSAAEMAHDLRLIVDPSLAELPRPTFEAPPEVRAKGFAKRVKRMFRGK